MSTAAKRLNSPHQPTGRWIRPKKRVAIYLRDAFICVYCGRELRGAAPREVTLDHLGPRCCGGSNESGNLVTACLRCNSQRGDRPWRDYAPGGAITRIEVLITKPLNMPLAKALLNDVTGGPMEDAR